MPRPSPVTDVLELLFRTLLQNANRDGGSGPELQPVVIISVQAVVRQRVESAIRHSNAIATRSDRDAHRVGEIVSATGYHGSPGRYLQAGFNNVIPLGGIVAGHLVMNFHYDRYIHVSNCADTDRSWCDREQSANRLFVPSVGKIPGRSFILDVELEVIGEQRKFE